MRIYLLWSIAFLGIALSPLRMLEFVETGQQPLRQGKPRQQQEEDSYTIVLPSVLSPKEIEIQDQVQGQAKAHIEAASQQRQKTKPPFKNYWREATIEDEQIIKQYQKKQKSKKGSKIKKVSKKNKKHTNNSKIAGIKFTDFLAKRKWFQKKKVSSPELVKKLTTNLRNRTNSLPNSFNTKREYLVQLKALKQKLQQTKKAIAQVESMNLFKEGPPVPPPRSQLPLRPQLPSRPVLSFRPVLPPRGLPLLPARQFNILKDISLGLSQNKEQSSLDGFPPFKREESSSSRYLKRRIHFQDQADGKQKPVAQIFSTEVQNEQIYVDPSQLNLPLKASENHRVNQWKIQQHVKEKKFFDSSAAFRPRSATTALILGEYQPISHTLRVKLETISRSNKSIEMPKDSKKRNIFHLRD